MSIRIALFGMAAVLSLSCASPAAAQLYDLTFAGKTQGVFTEDPAKAPLGVYDYVASYLINPTASPNYAPDGSTGFLFEGNDGTGFASPIVNVTFGFNGNSWTFTGANNFGSAYDLSYPPGVAPRDTGADLEGDLLSLYNDFEGDPIGGAGQVYFPGNVSGEPFYSGVLTPTSVSISQVAAVPEPATWGLMILGGFAVGGMLRFRRRQAVLNTTGNPLLQQPFRQLQQSRMRVSN